MAQFVLSNNVEEIRRLTSEGYVPIECSIGGVSVVDQFVMDHHGEHSGLEPVSVRAYRDLYGAAADRPGAVTTGAADADACWAAAALFGLLPHPQRVVVESTPPPVKAALTRDLSALAETIGRVDTRARSGSTSRRSREGLSSSPGTR